jgi:hypothetical protein
MRAFDELCASQGIDPRDLEEAFVSDNIALTAQNELLRQEVRGLRDALQSKSQPGDGDATLAVVSHQGVDEEGDEDLNHVFSEAIDFVSTKTGFAVNLVKQKVALNTFFPDARPQSILYAESTCSAHLSSLLPCIVGCDDVAGRIAGGKPPQACCGCVGQPRGVGEAAPGAGLCDGDGKDAEQRERRGRPLQLQPPGFLLFFLVAGLKMCHVSITHL